MAGYTRPCRRAGRSGVIVRRPKIIDKYTGHPAFYMSGVQILRKIRRTVRRYHVRRTKSLVVHSHFAKVNVQSYRSGSFIFSNESTINRLK